MYVKFRIFYNQDFFNKNVFKALIKNCQQDQQIMKIIHFKIYKKRHFLMVRIN